MGFKGSYAFDALKWIEYKEMKSFTHKDIARATNANCSHSVLRDIKKILSREDKKLTEIWETNENHKRYKRYFIEEIA